MEIRTNLSQESMFTASRSAHVREVFENSSHYLKRRGVDILFRRNTVRVLASRIPWKTLLDIGCGDGTISLPLLAPGKELLLLDLSANMARLARENVPGDSLGQVTVRNENFMTADLGNAPFDLIVTVGVLAHVASIDTFLERVRHTLRPDGYLIIEFTDARHPVGRLRTFSDQFKELLAPARYPTQKLSREQVFSSFSAQSLRPVSVFRYARIPLPLLSHLLPARLHYALTRRIFGDAERSRLQQFGNEYICLLQADAPSTI